MDIRNNDHPLTEMHEENGDSAVNVTEIKPDLGKLREYAKTKLALADQLRIVREGLSVLGKSKEERQCEELVVKLAEDKFTLAVLGQFKRGKSSLMNAIIGRELLPTGVLPLTSAITVLRYGPTERMIVSSEDSIFNDELPVSSLPDYVTEKGNPSNKRKVKDVCVELPVPFLRRGIEFVDTPGVGSSITANTAITYGFLPKCDAVLFVTSVDTPMTSLELEFLKEIGEYVDKIFFVVNKIDLVTEEERCEVLRFVTETIRSQVGHDNVKVFPVSARLGLSARTSQNAVLYEQSGIKALEEALASFLTEEKAAAFLTAIAHKALNILNDESVQDVLEEHEMRSSMIQHNQQDARTALTAARMKFETIYTDLLAGNIIKTAEVDVSLPVEEKNETGIETIAVNPTLAAGDITVDLRVRGCPVCRYMAKYASDFFSQWQYKIGSEEQAQAEFAAELGFCPLHTWQLLAMCSPHGASIGFAMLAEQVAHRLRENQNGNMVRQLVHDSRNCRVCKLLNKAEEEYIRMLARMLEQAPYQRQYSQSQGVCLRHLSMLMDVVSKDKIREFIISHAVERFEEDAEDMRSYAMKRDALRRTLANNNEEDAYRRAVIRIVGGRNVCMPWAEDGEI